MNQNENKNIDINKATNAEHPHDISRESAQLIIDTIPMICTVWDINATLLDCNQEAVRKFELNNKLEYIKRFFELCAEPDKDENNLSPKERIQNYIKLAKKSGRATFLWKHILPSGGLLPVDVTITCIEQSGEQVFIAYTQDLSRIEEAEERVRMMLDETPLACYLWDDKYNLIDCNKKAITLYGASSKEECLDLFYTSFPEVQANGENSMEFVRNTLHEVVDTKGIMEFEFLHKLPNGTLFPAEVTLKCIPWMNSHRVIGYSRDLREIKEIDKEMRRRASLLKALNVVSENLIASTPDNFFEVVHEQLKIIGTVVGVDRAYIWETYTENGKLHCRQTFEWSDGAEPQQGKDFTISMDYDDVPYWRDRVMSGKSVNSLVRDLPKEERAVLDPQGVLSLLVVPIEYKEQSWGFIGLDDCTSGKIASAVDEQVLRSCGILMVSSIIRNNTIRDVINARSELQINGNLLSTVNKAAKVLLEMGNENFDRTIQESLKILGEGVGADRVSIWRDYLDENNVLCSLRLPSWISGQPFDKDVKGSSIDYPSYVPEWDRDKERFAINDSLSNLNETLRNYHILRYSESLLLVPILLGGENWGFVGYSHLDESYRFTPAEIGILRSAGMMIAAAVERNDVTMDLIETKDKALASVRAKNEFLARMSHEVRTPMNAISGMISTAKKSDDEEKIHQCLESIEQSSQQLLAIVNDILDMSRIDSENLKIKRSPFDFDKMLKRVFDVHSQKISEKRISFNYDIFLPSGRRMIHDESRLSQVISKLLGNAVKFTPNGGHVTIRITEKPVRSMLSDIRIEVIDDGIGIPVNMKEKIFEFFEQADGGLTRRYGGIGLGLAISKAIVTQMGGKLWADSEEGNGSCFTLEFRTEWVQRNSEIEVGILESGISVLVVDDMSDVRVSFANTLETFGLPCETAATGNEAIEKAKMAAEIGKPFDVVFLDWYLPDGTASDFVESLREFGVSSIIVISVADWDDIHNEAKRVGLIKFMAKPLLPSHIYDCLVEVADPIPSSPASDAERYLDTEGGNVPDWSKRRFLLAEDNEINQMIASEILSDTGITIDIAENGREALNIFEANPEKYDLILMDMQMPIMDGLSATREIRSSKIPRGATIPIVAMTANAFVEDRDACLAAGMNGYLSKPIDIAVCYATIKKALLLEVRENIKNAKDN